MEIWFTEEWLCGLYDTLVELYKNTDYPIAVGYSKSMVSVCIERPQTGIYGKIPFPHLLHKATVLMDTIANFHPFADGNKRVGLLATYYFLHWNGYEFRIPENADEFLIDIVLGKFDLNQICMWLESNSKMTASSVFMNLFCYTLARLGSIPRMRWIFDIFVPIVVPDYPFAYLQYVMIKRKRKSKQ